MGVAKNLRGPMPIVLEAGAAVSRRVETSQAAGTRRPGPRGTHVRARDRARAREELRRLLERRLRVYAGLFGLGFGRGAVDTFRGSGRRDLELSAILDEHIVVMQSRVRQGRGWRECVRASDVLGLVQALDLVDDEIARARLAKRRMRASRTSLFL